MKAGLKIGVMLVAIALSIIIIQQALAEGELRTTLSFGDVDLREAVTGSPAAAEDIPSFSFAMRGTGRISIRNAPRIQTGKIVFSNNADYSGYYYEDEEGVLVKHDAPAIGSEAEALELRINNVDYVLVYYETLAEFAGLLPPDGADELLAEAGELGISEDTGLFALGGDEDTITIAAASANIAILPVSGENAITLTSEGDIARLEVLPDALLFSRRGGELSAEARERMAEAERRAAERAGAVGQAEAGAEAGCEDFDADEADNDIFKPSYVKVVNEEGAERITADYCAAQGDVSMLYEAECANGEAKVRRIECPAGSQCVQGACTSPGAAEKYCIDSDMIRDFSTDLKASVERKGTTVGFYAANVVDTGREFGAWGDYCSDETTLIEYYCSQGAAALGVFREVICPRGCNNGRCEELPFCFDTDGGNYEAVKGTVRRINADDIYSEHTDECMDANTVTEYSCRPISNIKANREACTAHAQCRSGYCCISETGCARDSPLYNKCTVPTGRQNTWPCYADEHCASNFCDMSKLVCADEPAEPIKADGESCAQLSVCRSGYCCREAGQCNRPELYDKCAAPPGGRNNGQTCYADEQCTSNFCDMSRLVCAESPGTALSSEYLFEGFSSVEISCGEGRYCDDGKCVEGEPPAPEEPAAACNRCDDYNPFNIRQGTSCTPAGTPTAWLLKKCPSGKYCNDNECVDESIATADITAAFERRQKWAMFLDNTLSWIENAKGIEPLSGKEIEDDMDDLAAEFSFLIESGGYDESWWDALLGR